MRLFLVVLLASALAASGQEATSTLPETPQPVAQQQTVQRDVRWDAVERLGPNETIEVRDRATGARAACVLDYVTDAVLACGVADSYGPFHRVVYPRAGIDRVWSTRLMPEPNGKLVGLFAAVGAAAGGLLFSEAGGKAVGFGVLVGGSLGAGSVLRVDTHLVTRRKLVYAAP